MSARYDVHTPGPCRVGMTLADALAYAHAGLDSLADKPTRELRWERTADDRLAARVVIKRSGRVVTGCTIRAQIEHAAAARVELDAVNVSAL